MKPNFFEFFFNKNVAQEPAQLLAQTWCPYLLWVLRNLPHKFEKLAHVTKSAKKNVTIWASRSARAPKNVFEKCNVYLSTTENFVQGARICDFQSVTADRFRVLKTICPENCRESKHDIATHPYPVGEQIERKLLNVPVKTQLAKLQIMPRRNLFKLALFLANFYSK